jgi:hypothetical protein
MRLSKLAHMDVDELAWRGRAGARIAWDRFQASRVTPSWDRAALSGALAPGPALDDARAGLAQGRWQEAHRALALHIASAPQRFALATSNRAAVTTRIRDRFPDAEAQSVARADSILAGKYDLLGYRALAFQQGAAPVDWQHDPVHARRAPGGFWSEVPYLSPDCGDHKIIWELNRHQHWLSLGRAYWLTGDIRYRRRCLAELASWLDANPPLRGINWASMLELGFRSISWLWALAFFADEHTADDDSPWIADLLLALDRQLTQVERNLSFYFSPNTHLLGEALALYVAGRSLPCLRHSPARESLGRQVLIDEARRQISPDGGHCERSTHYHRYTLDFYLLALIVARLTGDPAAAEFERAVSRLADAARLLADDRGILPQIGDDDGGTLFPIAGRAPSNIGDSLAVAAALLHRPDLQVGDAPEETFWLLAHPTLSAGIDQPFVQARPTASASLPDTGYYVSRSPRGDHIVIDGGAHGYLNGGHAHADALSLTLTVAGVPLLVDPGTGAYTVDQGLRDRLRSSQMHNTLVVDGRSQSIAHGPFSWKTMTGSTVRRWTTHRAFDYFEGAHDGYHPIEHRRHVLTLPGDMMIVADLIAGEGTHTAAVHWHLDPRWRVAVGEGTVTFATCNAQCQLVVPRGHIERFAADDATGLGWLAPVYGSVQPSTSLRVTHRGALPFWMASVFGLSRRNPVVDVEFLPVVAATGVLANAVAMRIVRAASIDVVMIADPADPGRRSGADGWKAGDVETDARVLFCREQDGRPSDVLLLDGSRVRANAQPALEFEAPHRFPSLHLRT